MIGRQQIPNLLTLARLAIVPLCLFIILVLPGQKMLLFWLFVLASLTDFLDGYLARRWQAVSPLGTLLDPVADKLLVALMLLYMLLTAEGASPWELFLPVSVILLRELYISGLREFLAARQIALPVSRGGKWKTALQMVAIAVLLFEQAMDQASSPLYGTGVLLLDLSALLAITSAVAYTRASMHAFR